MQALFIGHAYVDVTFLTDYMPTGDDKHVAQDYAISFGGNAVTAAFACAKLGIKPHLMVQQAPDRLGEMLDDMYTHYGIHTIQRPVQKSSLSLIMPNGNKRAIVRCREKNYLEPFDHNISLDGCQVLHVDGHQVDAALFYAKKCRELGIPVSLDGGSYLREGMKELLEYVDIAVVSELFCQQMHLPPAKAVANLLQRGVKVAAVTRGSAGVIWAEQGQEAQTLPAVKLPPDAVTDTSGAGDIFHGAYIFSMVQWPHHLWREHFSFASAAAAHAVQFLGNEESLPSLQQVQELLQSAA